MAKKKRSLKQRRVARHAAEKKATRRGLLGLLGLAVIAVSALIAFGNLRASLVPKADDLTEIASANIDGNIAAPVSIVEFGDFGCPACRAWHNSGIKEQLKTEFGDQISFIFRHFPVITAQSPQAAEAAQCAADQNAFWPYHDFLYEQAPHAALSLPELKQYGAVLGLDGEAFASCLDSGQHRGYVARDRQAAFSAGARGTPTFLVNGRVVDFFSYEAMASAIRQSLDS